MSLFSGAPAPDALPLPYEADSPAGLAARWVRWAASVGPFHNPIADTSGRYAALNQPDDVFFLAGNFGGVTRRSVTAPAGAPLFLPGLNRWEVPAFGPPEDLPAAFGDVVLDGVALGAERISTPEPFLVAGARLNPITRRRKAVPAVVTGLWRRIEAPDPGEHELRVRGGDGHGFALDVTVRLTVR